MAVFRGNQFWSFPVSARSLQNIQNKIPRRMLLRLRASVIILATSLQYFLLKMAAPLCAKFLNSSFPRFSQLCTRTLKDPWVLLSLQNLVSQYYAWVWLTPGPEWVTQPESHSVTSYTHTVSVTVSLSDWPWLWVTVSVKVTWVTESECECDSSPWPSDPSFGPGPLTVSSQFWLGECVFGLITTTTSLLEQRY